MRANLRELVLVEATRLLEQPGTDVHLADVVEGGAEAQRLQPVVRPAEPSRDRLGVAPDARGMTLERGVAGAHGGGE